MTRYNTLLLDQKAWDLVLDASGNIAMASPPYAVAQDVASAIRLFLGELYYDTSKGIPYFTEVLGHLPPTSLLVGYIEQATLNVPGVVSAQCVITAFTDRAVTGTVEFIDEQGQANGVSL